MIFRIMPAGSLTYAPDVRSKDLPLPRCRRVLSVCFFVCLFVCVYVRVRIFFKSHIINYLLTSNVPYCTGISNQLQP